MSKTLRVCTSADLPIESARSSDIIYFAYDKLQIYLGRNYYADPFCIVSAMPTNPVEGMLYILLGDGSVKSYLSNQVIDVATIESTDQVALLAKAGTTYFYKAEFRYLNLQTKMIVLPYQNGTYQLSVSRLKDVEINENTVIVYNPTSGGFELKGDVPNTERSGLLGIEDYTAENTSTVKTTISDNIIKSDVVVSPASDNIIKVLSNGIYGSTSDKVSTEAFDALIAAYTAYKESINGYITLIQQDLETAGATMSVSAIEAKIEEAMTAYKPTIDDVIANYDMVYKQLGMLRDSSVEYIDTTLANAKQEILSYLELYSNAWSKFTNDSSSTEYTPFTSSEIAIKGEVLVELYKKFSYLRSIEGTYTTRVGWHIITDENQFDNVSTITVLPETLTVTSEEGSTVGTTYLTVSPALTSGNIYKYKVTNVIPSYNEDLTTASNNYTTWDGVSQLTITNGDTVILAECTSAGKALKYAEFTAVSRLESPNELVLLNVVSTEGSKVGYTSLVVSPSLTSGNIYRVNTKPTTIPEYNTIVPDSYATWDGTSEFALGTDMSTVCLVECDSKYHRAKKAGIFSLDTRDELLKSITLTSVAGSTSGTTIVTVKTPALTTGNTYYYKTSSDNTLPALNKYITAAEGWLTFTSGSEITCPYGYNVIVVEADSSTKVKKAGSIAAVISNTLTTAKATYSTSTALIDFITVSDQESGSTLYYKSYASGETVPKLAYGTAIDTTVYSAYSSDTGVAVTAGGNIAIAETVSGVVHRFGVLSAVIKNADTLTLTSVAGTTTNYTKITVSPTKDTGNSYYYEIMTGDDGVTYPKYTVVSGNTITWDGTSEINLKGNATGNILRLFEVDASSKIIKVGQVSVTLAT